ncbi:2-oxo-4-hydroxy-4-carboxy-5-ureidoimidazoline decarboxylase [Microbacterium trichothecenolyticum]|uniref:2-oxo-4-hydroxy-4-carboxy-5-ureidoimidazoline decarboxylase n=1 Tax=Microbacterium trichothecenolyticum TaxID=69370 RepID=UPI001C6EDA99|nr:2-oxo-4-hydroxy-4-carboxy-5-ureidoimidazoline decarboxylase [Microbacterium trichothecenolyticum]MBW9120288.1 2-oxo-4-hydroxy-4-carboxy-5-ureidoimidazoline decarboxylase [Microbacterium trichothecenolyticum]
MRIEEFDELDTASARALVAVWAAIPAWVDAVVAGRPYSSVDELASRAADLAAGWTRADLDAALAHHPRIGEKPAGAGAEAAASRREQASMTDAAADVAGRIAAGNAAYEARFGRVFLIRAAGRSAEEMLAELERRLRTDDETEAAEATGQLAEIALLRLHAAIHDGHQDDEGADA